MDGNGDTTICSNWLPKHVRLALYLRDDFTCQYCGRNMKNDAANFVTLDHLIPRNPKVAHGNGSNDPTNLVSACKSCNSSRGDREWTLYAPGGAQDRINIQRFLPLNLELARAIIAGTAGDPETENLR